MKDLGIKIVVIFLIAVFESSVGLPVLTFSLFLIWMRQDLKYFLVWLVLVSLFISVLWGVAWWLSSLFLIFLKFIYDYFSKSISSKLLKILIVVSPVILLFAIVIGIDFYWRIVIYGLMSLAILVIFQRFLLVHYENKYL
jgi:hypothetical protein